MTIVIEMWFYRNWEQIARYPYDDKTVDKLGRIVVACAENEFPLRITLERTDWMNNLVPLPKV